LETQKLVLYIMEPLHMLSLYISTTVFTDGLLLASDI